MVGWHVTNQVERQAMSPSGGFVPSVDVQFVTDNGTSGTVTVPKSAFTADEVKRRIDAYVEHIANVENLSG